MYINRNGKKYYLTEKEIYIAYSELQYEKDIKEIFQRLEEANDQALYSNMIDKLKSDEEFAKRVAYRYRQYLNCGVNNDYQWTCIEDAYEFVERFRKKNEGN